MTQIFSKSNVKMTQRRIVIGDVHGHYYTLIKLLDEIAPNTDDQIYFLGDLIDRGSHSSQVVDLVINNNYQCLRGNHEEMLLNVFQEDTLGSDQLFKAWFYSGGQSTLVSYQHKLPPHHLQWFRNLPLYIDLGDFFLVHAGIDPKLPLDHQDSSQFCWIREDFHSMTEPYFPDKVIITGHTITFTFPGVNPGKIAQGVGWLDIDTGVYHSHSGWLTALDIDNSMVYQASVPLQRTRVMSLADAITPVTPEMVEQRRLTFSS